MKQCIFCMEWKEDKEFNREHIILEALGGKGDKDICLNVCTSCNSSLGTRVDASLLNQSITKYMRYKFKIRGKNGIPNPFKGIEVKKQEAGIYYLSGDSFPIQLVIVKELSKEENYWLQNLRCNLKTGEEIQEVVRRYEQVKHKAYYSEVMNLIVRANQKQMEEEKNMCEALNELFAEELRGASDELGEITGKISSDDLLGKIFSGFCIGK